MTTPSSIDSFEAEISRFYARLADSQVDLGHEYETVLLANISDLYEE
ncbi:integrase [Pseudomonas phage VW-6S]|nr:integrase [Pseudomonas phage VW-6S]